MSSDQLSYSISATNEDEDTDEPYSLASIMDDPETVVTLRRYFKQYEETNSCI